MSSTRWLVAVAAMALIGGASWAQGGPGGGMGPGKGMQGAGPGASMAGQGMGMGAGRGRMAQANADTTPGWTLMTPQERTEHQARMRDMKSRDECTTYMAQHREQMAARAKEKGGKPLATPRRDACAAVKP